MLENYMKNFLRGIICNAFLPCYIKKVFGYGLRQVGQKILIASHQKNFLSKIFLIKNISIKNISIKYFNKKYFSQMSKKFFNQKYFNQIFESKLF